MRTITIAYFADDADDGYPYRPMREEWGTNERDGGVFVRLADGTWGQRRGNGQTPVFHSPHDFRRYLRDKLEVRRGRIVETQGWT